MTAPDITQLLHGAAGGDREALEALTARVYGELERVADRKMRAHFGAELPGVTLEPAALVNETFLKLLESPRDFENRRHFFAFVTQVMLRALTDYERARSAQKRGGGQLRLTLSGVDGEASSPAIGVDALREALEALAALDPRKAEVVQLKLFWGLAMEEIAQTIGASARTVERDWRFARNWLKARLPTS